MSSRQAVARQRICAGRKGFCDGNRGGACALDDAVCEFGWGGDLAEHVASIHCRVVKVVPHVFGGDKIGEPVPGADPDTAKTYLEWREKNRVVDTLERRRVDKGRQEPGPDDSVVDHMAVPGHAAGGRRRGFRNCGVLGLCFREPRCDRTLAQEAVEVIAADQRTRGDAIGQQRSDRGLARARRPRHHDHVAHDRPFCPRSELPRMPRHHAAVLRPSRARAGGRRRSRSGGRSRGRR